MLGFNGGRLGVRNVPTTEIASGVWGQNEQSIANRAAIWPQTGGDPNFSSVSLLLHMNGSNGSTTFTDSSPSPKTITAVGNAQVSTAQSKFGGASLLLDGSGDNLSVPDSDAFYLPGDFTVECFVYALSWSGNSGYVQLMGQWPVADFAPLIPYFLNGVPSIAASSNQSSWDILNTGTGSAIPTSTWTHVAWVRSGNKWSVYVDGTERVLSASASGTPYNAAAALAIGRSVDGGPQYAFNGYIDELRITKGVARYTANFTAPTAPFPDY